MKFRTLCFMVLLAAGIVFVAGCGKEASAPADKKESAAKANTPIEVARSFYEALKKEDTASAISLSDGELKEIIKKAAEYSAQIKKAAADGDETAKEKLAERDKAFRETQAVFKGEKIDGDLATVDVVMIRNGKSEVDKVFFKKVNGEWKVISENDYRIANGDPRPIDVTKKFVKACDDSDEIAARELVSGKDMRAKAQKDALEGRKQKAIRNAKFSDPIIKDDKAIVLRTYETYDFVNLEKVDGKWKVTGVGKNSHKEEAKNEEKDVEARRNRSFGDAKIDGDTAKVKVVKKNGEGQNDVKEYQLEKEGGAWKISKIKEPEDEKNKEGNGDKK